METVMGMNMEEFVSKCEGYSTSGLRGTSICIFFLLLVTQSKPLGLMANENDRRCTLKRVVRTAIRRGLGTLFDNNSQCFIDDQTS
jgi:hypothetical protein